MVIKPAIAIVGATAAGKTDYALEIAARENVELISVDSRQVYKHLQIGTAKPAGSWKNDHYLVQGIPYHLLDILEPNQTFSAADFRARALPLLDAIRGRGKQPILVGGTGLYFKALMEGLAPLPPADEAVRTRLKQEASDQGRGALHARLTQVDPAAAAKIPANNIQRLVRALEVYELTGKPISAFHAEQVREGPALDFIGIDPGREELVRRIEARCRRMLEDGMIEETQTLLERGVPETAPALTGLGYPRVIRLLKGEITKEDCLALLQQDSRQYAKRQMTWFRHQLPVQWKK